MFAYSDNLATCSAASGSAAKVVALRELLETPPDVEDAWRLMWLGFESQKKRHSWVGSLPCSAKFFTGTPLSSNINFSKLQFDLQREMENNFVEF